MDCEKIGALLKKLRTEHGLTQKQAAERLSVSDKTVSKWECGGNFPNVRRVRGSSFKRRADNRQSERRKYEKD